MTAPFSYIPQMKVRDELVHFYQDDGVVLHSFFKITVFIPLSLLAAFNFPFP